MNAATFHRLHNLRMENDAAGYAMQEMAPRFAALANRHQNGTAPVAVSAFQLFQTPATLAARLVALLELTPGARVLEPSAGLGRILDALAPHQPAEIVAVEMAAACAEQLFKRENITLRQRDFMNCLPEELGTFDAIAMNPPFTMRSDIRHILHALKFLKPGGTLAALCMDTQHRESALRHLSATWEKIPAGTFRAEGTEVPTILLTIKA
jgi:16S rRNA A1518/A1519 N6-dimethyltransferase RsmA/KsgA/DIM1 with predicted DNA glycosylase/AP lyase activity